MESRYNGQADDLLPYLKRIGTRLKLRAGWIFAQRSLWLAGLAMVLIQAGGRIWPVERLLTWTLLPLAVWALVNLLYGLFLPQRAMNVARRTDLELGLKERLSTALILAIAPEKGGRLPAHLASFESELVSKQHTDALETVRAIRPGADFPLPWLRRPLLLAAGLAALALLLAYLPNPMDAILAERAAIAQAAEREAERVEEIREEIEESAELTPEEREELQRQLEELARQLRENRGDRAEALADLSRMEEQLRQRLDPNAAQRQAALEALANQMQSLAGEDSPQNGDMSEGAKAMEELAEQLPEMEPAEQQALAQSLSQMAARAAQAGDAALAQALASLAQAAASGDPQAAQQAAQQASNALSQAQSNLDAQAALQRALSELQGSRQAIARAGQPMAANQGQQGQGEGQGEGQGQGQGQGQGEGQGQGQGQGEGQGQGQGQGQNQGQGQGSGGGSNANTLPPFTGSGTASRPQGQGRPGGTGDFEPQVYSPWERRPGSGDPLSIPGQDTDQGETQVREQNNPLPGAPGEALVPYQEVFYEYLDAANQAIDQSYIPTSLKDYVREYFSQLEP